LIRIKKRGWPFVKLLVFLISLLPLASIVSDAVQNNLGANPVQMLQYRTGDWALRFLLITLALTPLKILFGVVFQMRFRRMMGLFAFFYASLHLTVYVGLDQSFSWTHITEDVPKSPYILVGLSAFLLLLPLALTSTHRMIQRLGRNWQRLHRLIYLSALLAVVHFFWLVKADLREPAIYAGVLVFLLGVRTVHARRKAEVRRWKSKDRNQTPEARILIPDT
jgi:methionine sulfoxide reductase heme-binding subunit